MGFSKGLCGTLCQLGSLRRTHGPVDVESAAYIPFYPSCYTKYIDVIDRFGSFTGLRATTLA
jgi:hypothetical protein